MKSNPEGWSVVVVGFWNRMIFSPEWVTQKLTTQKEIGIEIPVGQPGLQPRLMFDGISLRVDPRRLNLGTDKAQDERLAVMERVALTALVELPHTPISGAGVNFQFIEDDPSGLVLRAFEVADNNQLADAGYGLKSTVLRRELHRDAVVVNLTLTLSADHKVTVDFNFHCDGNIEVVRRFIEGNVLPYRERSLDLLQQVYGLSL